MIIWLLFNENEDNPIEIPFKDKFRVFSTVEACLEEAKKIGFTDPLGMGISRTPGVMNWYAAGNVNVKFIGLEVVGEVPVQETPRKATCDPYDLSTHKGRWRGRKKP